MAMRRELVPVRFVLGLGLLLPLAGLAAGTTVAQAPAAAPASAAVKPQLGTVKAINGDALTVATDAGPTVTITVPDGAKISQLAVGSTDLKTATPGTFANVTVGDRVLASVKAGDTTGTFTARQVVVMKSADIAKMQADQQADWKARGTGGLVSTVDAATGAIALKSGTKKLTLTTSSKTVFRRFAKDSVKYEDARLGTIADIHPDDQLQARGTKSADGTSMQAEEVISGTFKNLSGLIASIDPASGNITVKDLLTKKMVTVNITANSDVRTMPPQMAARFGTQGGGGQGGGRRGGGGGQSGAGGDPASTRSSAGADLAQMIPRMPTITLAGLHKGDAVMIVASESAPGASTETAVTVVSGVDSILTANPNGGMDLSMSVGGGGGGE
jgi:hypothetical protein